MEYSSLPYNGLIKRNEPLGSYTTFGVGGPAEVFFEPRTNDEVRELLAFGRDNNLPVKVIGKGSNILVNDSGVRGVVLYFGSDNFNKIERENASIVVGASVSLPLLVNKSIEWGLGGLEPLIGIPGTVGGAVAINAGGKYGTISECIQSVTAIEIDGSIRRYDREDVDFGYRKNCFPNQVITEIMLKLKKCGSSELRRRSREILEEKKKSQPLSAKSAGCIFKNPNGYSAGYLIEHAGLKGKIIGGAKVSEKHANFIINTGNACAADLLRLIDMARSTVLEKFNVLLELEIQVW